MRTYILLAMLILAGCGAQKEEAPATPPAAAENTNPDASNGTSNGGTAAEEGSTPQEPAESSGNAGEEVDPQEASSVEALLEGQYAFADETGKRLLTVEGDTAAGDGKSYRYAVGSNGAVLPIAFVKEQPGDDRDNGRQTMYNFEHLAGAVYAIQEGAAEPNATYFVTASDAWKNAELLPVDMASRGERATEEVTASVAAAMDRKVQYAAKIGDLGGEAALYLVQFERQEDDMLASLVLQRGERLHFYSMAAVYNEGGTWRVDDAGEIHAEEFGLLAAAQTAEGLLLGVTWIGAEGENAFFIREAGEKLQEAGPRVGRYMAPE